ncbi:PLP-dependent aminotransferase family protein [Alicyclobacillus sp. SO9]|uniref:aminotransferase-like domain-containing protein n=1 Tax=Alicyclobacillus sp. SO9 TaxID=2665646 RepID=UPI0018E79F12|nr:PLP-dependent aminotransferase family protein [Alicyclobacillus sp. SO9]QQE79862.1 PLP-dependent aminotransferase family protein [Alicyclobacillus sp. SO9]
MIEWMKDDPKTVRELVEWLVTSIHEGVWLPKTRLPPERSLADQFGLNRSTVATAYLELQARGLVDRRQGSGTYVRDDLWGITPDWPRYLEQAAFRPLAPLARKIAETRQRRDILDFSDGNIGPEVWPVESMQRLLAGVDLNEVLGFGHPLGLPALRETVSSEIKRNLNVKVDPESLLITAGAQQALYLLARGLLHPGDSIAIEKPSFYYSQALFQSCGVRLLPIPMDKDGVLPDALKELVRKHRPAMVWLNPTYHNPTGVTLNLERRQAVVAICNAWNLPIVEDDTFAHLQVAGTPKVPSPLFRLAEQSSVLYVGSLSKVVAPGLRIGWVAGPRAIITRLAEIRSQIDSGTPGLVQGLAAAFLSSPGWQSHRRTVSQALRQRRDAFAHSLSTFAARGATWTVPAGGLHFWLKLGGAMPDELRVETAVNSGVTYAPGRLYGAEDGFARLNYVRLSPTEAALGIARLAEAITGGPPHSTRSHI